MTMLGCGKGGSVDVIGYPIGHSLRARASGSAYLSCTFGAAATSNNKLTVSMFVKRGKLGTAQSIFYIGPSSPAGNMLRMSFTASNQLQVICDSGSTYGATCTGVMRDTAAWYHIVLVIDYNNATATDRIKFYVNGVEAADNMPTAAPPTSHTLVNGSGDVMRIGDTSYFDGYVAEPNVVDGQVLDASYFGTFNGDGVWVPKKYTGTYGNNGSYLPFSNGSSTTTLGYDYQIADRSGTKNDWTLTNFSLTAGEDYDWMLDTPTNNFPTWNPLLNSNPTSFTKGNLIGYAGVTYQGVVSTQAFNAATDNVYWEVVPVSGAATGNIGLVKATKFQNPAWQTDVRQQANTTDVFVYIFGGAHAYYNTTAVTITPTTAYTLGDVIGFAVSGGSLYVYKNGTALNSGAALVTGMTGEWYPAGWNGSSTGAMTYKLMAGQAPLDASATWNSAAGGYFLNTSIPSGCKALCTANMPAVAITKPKSCFDVHTRSGTGASTSITGKSFQPDLVWTKARSAATDHKLTDAVRGATKALISDTTGAETTDANGLTAFNSDGYTIGSDTNYNNSTGPVTYVDWFWKASATAGFSVVTFTAPASGNGTVAHGLGRAPAMAIIKCRGTTGEWSVYHQGLTTPDTYRLKLNLTDAQASVANSWLNTDSTNLGYLVGTTAVASQTHVAYCFAEVPGFSKLGTYTGNGNADGPFVYCGFKPKFVLCKGSGVTGAWWLFDAARPGYNVQGGQLWPDQATAESTSAALDITANGFKLRLSTNPNTSNAYIFAAFAESPFGGSNCYPAPAR